MSSLHPAPLARSPLFVCIAALLGLHAQGARADGPILVTDCSDPGLAGDPTLRNAIFNAASGDIIELANAPCSTITLHTSIFGDTIYVMQKDLTIQNSSPNQITVDGSQLPSGNQGLSSDSRVFTHKPSEVGTLTIDHVNVTGGHSQHDDNAAYGGCIFTNGALVLTNSTVSACSAVSATPGHESRSALGGAIYAGGNITLTGSTVTGSTLTSPLSAAYGGGVFSKGLVQANNSTISNNKVYSEIAGGGGGVRGTSGVSLVHSIVAGNSAHATTLGPNGGGVSCQGGPIDISYSTISNNSVLGTPLNGMGGGVFGTANVSLVKTTVSGNSSSNNAGGVAAYSPYNGNTFTVIASTISGNTAQNVIGGIQTDAYTTKIYNSTIAFNTAVQGFIYDGNVAMSPGLALDGRRDTLLVTLESNILAHNSFGPDTDDDLSAVEFNVHTITIDPNVSHNLIRTSVPPASGLPAGTITGCPLLGPLRDNGGPTWTHALFSHSAAIDFGSNSLNYHQDQRGAEADGPPYPFPRVSTVAADIGAYEVNKTDVVFNAEFETCAPLVP